MYKAEDINQKGDGTDEWLAKVLPDRHIRGRVQKFGGRGFYQIRTDVLIGLLILRLKSVESLRLHYMFLGTESYLPVTLYKKYLKKLKHVWLKQINAGSTNLVLGGSERC